MIHWIESGGGPLILIAREDLRDWRGLEGGGLATDYARACELKELIGVLPVGSGAGVVLADEPLPTAWFGDVPHADGALTRWEYADSDDDAQAAISSLGIPAITDPVLTFGVAGPLLLFDSARPGNPLPPHIEVGPLRSGRYVIATERSRPSPRASFYVHRFVPLSSRTVERGRNDER